MARRAPFRNSLLALFFLSACTARQPGIPPTCLRANDAGLQQRSGCLYFYGTPFDGYVCELYASGDTASITGYRGGREEGPQHRWYPSGARMEERYYQEGRKESTHRGWWPDGKQKFIYHFVHDGHEGSAEEWFSTGQLFRRFHYRAGQEDGLQQMWWPNNALRANYVVKDGQQYGLIGRKLCKNPAHETK